VTYVYFPGTTCILKNRRSTKWQMDKHLWRWNKPRMAYTLLLLLMLMDDWHSTWFIAYSTFTSLIFRNPPLQLRAMHSEMRTAQTFVQHAARLPSDWTLQLWRGKPSDRPTSSLRIQTRPNHLALYTTSQSARLVYFQLMQFPVARNQATSRPHITIVTMKLARETQRLRMCEN